ncbi:MAG: hypothetical protein J6J42_04900 [Lachnospiraceae bacterium]|nr:hypothetical protein [Lachnospiraceae bacterium]MBP3609656.1 hypothetical protein [Lachnospiraceae bacterium]
MSKTKIVVFKLKELLLTAALVVFGVAILLLVVALVSMEKESTPGITPPSAQSDSTETSAMYYPGVYTSTMELNDTTIHLELVCDSDHINSVRLVNLDEAVETMYPLLNPALEDLELQLSKNIPFEELELTEGSTYTQTLLMEAIERTLEKAVVE